MQKTSPAKKIGVLGGMGPAASAEFIRLLTARAPAGRDQEHPIIYLLSDAQVPDRTDAIKGLGADPTARLRADLEQLISWGADFLATPCNTAHVFIDTFCEELSVPYVHIVRETIASAREKSPQGAWLLATDGTCQSGLYTSWADRMGYTLHKVTEDRQKKVMRCVEFVKAGKMPESGELMREIVKELKRDKDILVMTACTELPLAYDASGLPQDESVSSLVALADACLEIVYPGQYKRT